MTRKPLTDLLAVGALLATLMVAGCSLMGSGDVQLDSSSGLFEQARLTYQIETARLSEAGPARPNAAAGEQLVAYQTAAAGIPSGVATVHVEWPHPEKRPGMAKVTLKIEDQPGAAPAPSSASAASGWRKWWESTRGAWSGNDNQQGSYEVWSLDIPSSEVSEMVNQLRAGGYFDNYADAGNTAQVTTELDGARVRKRWQRVARLDDLVLRVRQQGTLMASNRPVNHSQPAASVVAYQQMRAEEEGFAIATDQAPAGNGKPYGSQPAVQMTRLPAVNPPMQR